MYYFILCGCVSLSMILGNIFFLNANANEVSGLSSFMKNELHNKEMKILVLIIASDNQPVYVEQQMIWRSYMHLDPEHIEAYFIKANHDLATDFEIQGDIIWTKGIESFSGILNKTLLSFEAMLSRMHEFDYVLRANLSSFYVFERLLKFLKNLPKEKYYCGYSTPKAPFIFGSGIILSPDLVELMIKNKKELIDRQKIDDVAIGLFCRDHNINKIFAPRLWFHDLKTWNETKNKISEDVFQFRAKIGGARLTDEIFIQKELLKMFYPQVS